jgi:uncharacterized protein
MPDWRTKLVDTVTGECQPVDKLSHMTRLVALTQRVSENLSYDDDVVFAAVWLHDLGVFHGHRPSDPIELASWDHTAYSMDRSPAVLTRIGFPSEKIPATIEAIRTHKPNDDPTTIEGTILRDADILEQLGAVTVLRTASKVGRDTRFTTLDDVVKTLRKQLDELPAKLRLESAKSLAVPRIEALRQFLEAWKWESN